MNNFSDLWGTGAVLSFLVPSPGMIRAGGVWPKCENPIKAVSGVWAMEGWVCIQKACLLPLGMASPGVIVGSSFPRCQNTKIKRHA